MFKQLNYMKIWMALVLICLIQGTTYAAVTFKEVTVTGVGMSLEEATNNALTQAISMVNGKNVQTKTVITTMSGGGKSQEAAEIEALGEFFESLAAAVAEAEGRPVPTKREKEPEDSKPKYTQDYLKEMIDETKGGIKSYELLKQSKNSDGWDVVTIKAQVAVFELPKESMRTRIAVLPFTFFDVEGDTERFNRLLTQGLNNYLVQTKKFTVLDRDFINQVASEKQSILDGKTPVSEMAKIGNEISADFILVGAVEDFYVKTKTKTILATGGKVTKEHVYMHLSYRLIDVATKQISFSNTMKTTMPISSDRFQADSKMTDKMASSLGEEILFSIYPVMVEKINGADIYLGMGGNQFKKGNVYEMFEKGDQIIDSYTNEVLGTTETLVGTIKITSVSSNYSKATSTQNIDFSDGFELGKYIVRPVKIDEEAAEKAKFKKAKKKIKEKRKEFQESLDDDW
jgi:TolB-like protein